MLQLIPEGQLRMPIPKTCKYKQLATEKRELVISLRRRGLSYPQIEKETGIPKSTAYDCVKKYLDEINKECRDSVQQQREIDLERLERMLDALEGKILDGNERAMETYIKIMKRKAAMLGMDEPQKSSVDVSGDGLKAVFEFADNGRGLLKPPDEKI